MSEKLKEIGGYFGLEEFCGKEYHGDLIGVNSGRNALLYILKAKNVKKLFIPLFLCDTVYKLCERENYPFEFYSVNRNFLPVFDRELKEDEWLYIVNYYGQISNEQVTCLKEKYGNIIFDNVQAFFQKPVRGVDTVYSCRKFFGVPDGGYVATDKLLLEELPQDSSKDRMKHILGRFEESGSEYYAYFQENDEKFYEEELKQMSPVTHNILRAVDYDKVRQKRNENYSVLQEALGKQNKLNFNMPDGPYCYPFYCENGMQLKKRLADKKIYVATLWPNVFGMGDVLAQDYAENILPLPCDQRYSKADMEYLVLQLLNNQ